MQNGSVKKDLASLTAAARSGDAVALEKLLAGFMQPVYRFGLKMCRDGDDAQDVLQDTMLAAAKGVGSFRGESEVGTWLFTIARRACLRRRRRRGEPAASVPLDEAVTASADALIERERHPEANAALREMAVVLDRALATLAPAYREVLLLRDVEGLTAPEVARVLGIGLEAVKSRLHRARLAMRVQLAPVLEPSRSAAGASCERVLSVLSRHIEGDLDARACASMEAHVATCPSCRSACDGLRRTLAVCSGYVGAAVPSEVQHSVREALHHVIEEWRDASSV